VWRGGHVLFETTEAGTITRSYTWGIGADDLVAITNHQDANKRYYVVQDLLRSVRGLVERTATGGVWRAAWRYTPYGEMLTTDGSVNFPVRFRWAGAMYDEETGLYFLRTRSYDPRFGRFIQEDVAGFAGGGNLYAYASDPTSGRDPDGMMSMPEPQYHGDRMDWSMSGGGGNDPFAIFEWAENLGGELFNPPNCNPVKCAVMQSASSKSGVTALLTNAVRGIDCYKNGTTCVEFSTGVVPAWIGGPLRSAGFVTKHGLEQLADPSRPGLLRTLWTTLRPTNVMTQADGATVYIQQEGSRYWVSIWGDGGYVTGFSNLTFGRLSGLARNYVRTLSA